MQLQRGTGKKIKFLERYRQPKSIYSAHKSRCRSTRGALPVNITRGHPFSPSYQYSDWYRVSTKDIVKRGGRGLLSYYPSLGVALQLLYPEYKWQLSSFLENAPTLPERRMPPGYWKSTTNLLLSLTDAEKRLGIQNVRLAPPSPL